MRLLPAAVDDSCEYCAGSTSSDSRAEQSRAAVKCSARPVGRPRAFSEVSCWTRRAMKNPLVGRTHVPPRPYALRRDLLRSFVRYGRYGKDFYRYIVRPIDAQSPCADSIFPIRALAPIHTSIHTSTLRQNSSKDATPPPPPKIVSRVRRKTPSQICT